MVEESFVEDFSEQVETAIRAILCTIQNLAERNNKKAEDSAVDKRLQEEDGGKEEEASFKSLQPGHLTKLLEDDFWASVSTLHVQKIISSVSELLERLKSCSEDGNTTKHKGGPLKHSDWHLFVSGLQPVLWLASAPDTHPVWLLRPCPLLPDRIAGHSPEHGKDALCACPDLYRALPEGVLFT